MKALPVFSVEIVCNSPKHVDLLGEKHVNLIKYPRQSRRELRLQLYIVLKMLFDAKMVCILYFCCFRGKISVENAPIAKFNL